MRERALAVNKSDPASFISITHAQWSSKEKIEGL